MLKERWAEADARWQEERVLMQERALETKAIIAELKEHRDERRRQPRVRVVRPSVALSEPATDEYVIAGEVAVKAAAQRRDDAACRGNARD